jgi:hypothetical protein
VLEQRREGRALICHARYERITALAGYLISECCADTSLDDIAPLKKVTETMA